MKSIISNERECYICKNPTVLHKHHIFEGSGRRKLSEKYGCWVYLCPYHHTLGDAAVHNNKALDLMLKKTAQKAWEKNLGDTDAFIRVFRKSYKED